MKNKCLSKIEEATLYYNGAEMTHTAKSFLQKGSHELIIEGLSPNTDQKSIKIKASNGVIISSFEFSVNYLKEENLGQNAQKLKEEMDSQKKELEKIETSIQIHEEMLSFLKESIEKKTSGSKKGPEIEDLMKALDFYKTKSMELENELFKDHEKENQIREKINDLSAQFNQESVKNTKAAGILKLNLSSPAENECDFNIQCYTNYAGWYPFHEINVESAEKPVKIISKAKVFQTTGLDWDKVKLTLSTAVPSFGKTAPLFNAWFLNFIEPTPLPTARVLGGLGQMKKSVSAAQNMYSYNDCEVEEVCCMKEYDEIECQKSPEPIYIVDNLTVASDYFYSIDSSIVKESVFLDSASAVARFGSFAAGGAYVLTLKTHLDFVSESGNALNVTYEIDLLYSIPGNGKKQNIDLKSHEISASFMYYCAPKLDSETYLIAEISNWEKLGLLSGNAFVTYDGTFIGETYIDAESTHGKLSLTLGTDKRVAVKREKLKEYSSKGLFGNDVKQEFAYQLTVRNNQNQKIKLVLKDQYPLSSRKEIMVELSKDSTPFSFHKEDLGVVTWEYDFNPGESRVYKLVYNIKYPKGNELNLQ